MSKNRIDIITYVEFLHPIRFRELGARQMQSLTDEECDELRAVPGGVMVTRGKRRFMVWAANIRYAELVTFEPEPVR